MCIKEGVHHSLRNLSSVIAHAKFFQITLIFIRSEHYGISGKGQKGVSKFMNGMSGLSKSKIEKFFYFRCIFDIKIKNQPLTGFSISKIKIENHSGGLKRGQDWFFDIKSKIENRI